MANEHKTVNGSPTGTWEKSKIIANIVGVILIPIVIAVIGYTINLSIKKSESRTKTLELAVDILKTDPKLTGEELRNWAIEVAAQNSDVPLKEEARVFLRTRGILGEHINLFHEFALAYEKKVEGAVLKAAFSAGSADSQVLVKGRDVFTRKERADTIIEHDRLLKDRFELLNGVIRNVRLLRTYFYALAGLAAKDGQSELKKYTASIVASLDKQLRESMGGKMSGSSIGKCIGKLKSDNIQLAVSEAYPDALKTELKMHGSTILRHLELQRCVLMLLEELLQTDQAVQVSARESKEVVDPYISDSDLPKSWSERRNEVLGAILTGNPILDAADSTLQFKIAFISLAEGRLTSIVQDIGGNLPTRGRKPSRSSQPSVNSDD